MKVARRVSLPVAITIFCIVIFLGLTVAFLTREKRLVTLNKVKKEEIKRTDYTQVARRTLDWIDKQRNDQGWYILERGCDHETKTCDIVWDNKEGNKDGLIVTWARLNFFEQHGDSKDLEIVKRDIDLFYDKYKDDNLKDSLWICKITYEMAQSKHLDQSQKDKLKELCMKTNNVGFEEVKQSLYSDNRIALSKRDTWRDWFGYKVIGRKFNVNFGIVTELIAKNRWLDGKSEEFTMDLAKSYLDLLKKRIEVGGGNANEVCLAGIGSLGMYEFGGKEEKEIDFVKDIYNLRINHQGDRKRYQTAVCAYLIKELIRITGNNEYMTGLERQNKLMMTSLEDREGSYAQTVGDNGFMKTISGGLDLLEKNVVENGLIVELLRN
jgi:hypothetical protein